MRKQKTATVAEPSAQESAVILPTDGAIRLVFQVRFRTVYGQQVFLVLHPAHSGDEQLSWAQPKLPMQYFDEGHWRLEVELVKQNGFKDEDYYYNYLIENADGSISYDWGQDKSFNLSKIQRRQLVMVDTWNYAGYPENAFYTEPFKNVLLAANYTAVRQATPAHITHTLRVKTPLLPKGHTLCFLSSSKTLGEWNTADPLLLSKGKNDEAYELNLDLSTEAFPIAYKYGVYDTVNGKFIRYEDGNNRVLHDGGAGDQQTIVHDGWAVLPADHWKAAGIAIPVFSLRSEKSFGIGEFSDVPLLVDWAKKTGLHMIQLLPVNDTTATHTWTDSYPYAAISAFALHPVYLNLTKIAGKKHAAKLQKLEAERIGLNELDAVDYEAVIKLKTAFVNDIFEEERTAFLSDKEYHQYFEQNKHWLVPYAAFCYLRDLYGTVDFNQWPSFSSYNNKEIAKLTDPAGAAFNEISFHYFIQYHLHLQLKEATAYAHANGIIVKGDIAIGVYRHGADAWQSPELYHLDVQAGAPPDDFAVTGQNWGFPTYNWERMREDGFAWWKQRFEQMSYYFDAFRIDHILGFFRIWSIPMHAVEGIMGHFVPAIPVHISEFHQSNTWFDYHRYTRPYITDNVLWKVFGYDNELVKSLFLEDDDFQTYALKPEYATQRQVEAHFNSLEQDEFHARIRQGLYSLISNVILFEVEGSGSQQFHFRFGMENTSSFQQLEYSTQDKLRELYVDYFFRRQDDFWMKEAMQKLPALKRVTNMLVCGEDLGLVPSCVPEAMRQLGLLSLEIQRMPKDPAKEFFHPNDAPYLSVVTPSTHDMSTIRGWWEEDHARTQQFYNNELGQPGEAPQYCEAWLNKSIIVQHLYSPAMWSIFQLQDLLGIDASIRRESPADERINIPANPKHYWRYRMHLTLEELLVAEDFNEELRGLVRSSGR